MPIDWFWVQSPAHWNTLRLMLEDVSSCAMSALTLICRVSSLVFQACPKVIWSIRAGDESKRGTAFAFLFGVNWLLRCGVTASFGVFFHEIKCNGVARFTEFMIWNKFHPSYFHLIPFHSITHEILTTAALSFLSNMNPGLLMAWFPLKHSWGASWQRQETVLKMSPSQWPNVSGGKKQ